MKILQRGKNKGNIRIEQHPLKGLWCSIRHHIGKKNGIIYGAFDSDMQPILVIRKGDNHIPIPESKELIQNSDMRGVLNTIKSWGIPISATTEKLVSIF